MKRMNENKSSVQEISKWPDSFLVSYVSRAQFKAFWLLFSNGILCMGLSEHL